MTISFDDIDIPIVETVPPEEDDDDDDIEDDAASNAGSEASISEYGGVGPHGCDSFLVLGLTFLDPSFLD
jgi:hypothetical protein